VGSHTHKALVPPNMLHPPRTLLGSASSSRLGRSPLGQSYHAGSALPVGRRGDDDVSLGKGPMGHGKVSQLEGPLC